MRKAAFTFGFALLILLSTSLSLHAIPQSFFGNGFFGPVIPATPRFGANLTEDFLNIARWDVGELPGPWAAQAGTDRQRMTANPVLFGAVPDSVTATRKNGVLDRIDITYLDAGTFFRYKLGGEKSHRDREVGEERRAEFESLYRKFSADLKARLEKGCGSPSSATVGKSELLRARFSDYRWEDFTLRLATRPGHSVGLQIRRDSENRSGYLSPAKAMLTKSDRASRLAANVERTERGDLLVRSLPVVYQGNTPFCGIHSLAMLSQYLGLDITADELAAAARFQNTGSARGSRIFDLYHAAAEEAGMKLKVSSRFDPRRVSKSLESGLPVIVWRRVSREREDAHSKFAARLAGNPDARVPKSNARDWPRRDKKSLPSHGSVVTGINGERGEAVYSEPWGTSARDRRMAIDELKATTYAVFYFRFE